MTDHAHDLTLRPEPASARARGLRRRGRLGDRLNERHGDRRGNAIILVAGILVLLVIIATAYVTRTQSARLTSVAVQHSQTQSNSAEVIADTLASIVSDALFPAPVDPNDPALISGIASSNYARLSLDWNPVRYGVDRDFDGDGFADYPYNFAPYQVVPWTNWPDAPRLASQWPKDVGAPAGDDTLNEGNPYGNPGFGDTRWLRDFEPQRIDFYTSGNPGSDGRPDLFRMWRHLTNISHPNNGFRIATDIADVRTGTLVTDLSVPVEQWLVSILPEDGHFATNTDDATITWRENDFIGTLWFDWFYNYPNVYRNPARIPPNFYHLKDLDGDGVFLEPGERPQDEFVRGSWRWLVNRVLTDTDGDGFTDSFWFLAPTPIERGIRQIVAVSVVDNSAMFNANVATSFWWGDLNFIERFGTAGETPADLAAAGEQLDEANPPVASWNVGFFDDHKQSELYFDYPAWYGRNTLNLYNGTGGDNREQVRWLGTNGWPRQRADNRWFDRLTALGIFDNPEGLFPTAQQGGAMSRAQERRRFWLYGASQPFAATAGLTPFTTQDELELRMFHGQNYPWIFSRFENTLNLSSFDNNDEYSFVRSPLGYDESTEYLDQLTSTELLWDHRRKMTLFNGARNDLLPPWLRWRWIDRGAREDIPFEVEVDKANNPTQPVEQRFFTQAGWKLDLREEPPDPTLYDPIPGTFWLHERLPWTLLHALADGDETGGAWLGGTYTGAEVDEVRKAAAGLAANILARRDLDTEAPLVDDPATTVIEAVPVGLPEWGGVPADATTQMLGMERQPFLMEAFVAHVYRQWEIPTRSSDGAGWTNSGDDMIVEDYDIFGESGTLQTTVAVLQIANPFDEPIVLYDITQPDLAPYVVDFFGQQISLREVGEALRNGNEPFVLPPARHDRPATMIIYAIDGGFDPTGSSQFKLKLEDFLDIQPTDHPIDNDVDTADTILVDLTGNARLSGIPTWSMRRSTYDGLSNTANISLIRVDDPNGAMPAAVVIDRIDNPNADDTNPDQYREIIIDLGDNKPPTWSDLVAAGIPAPLVAPVEPFPTLGWDVPSLPDATTHWMQYARVTRAWGRDTDGGIFADPDERNPRYIYGTNLVTHSGETPTQDGRGNRYFVRHWGPSDIDGVLFNFALMPDDGENGLPWITHDYDPPNRGIQARKPTFFDMAHELDPASQNIPPQWGYPDKGFYHSPYALQMLQKDNDYDQVGELLSTWLYGHELAFVDLGGGVFEYTSTTRTFSEYMAREQNAHPNDPLVNRLVDHEDPIGAGVPTDPLDARHAYPVLPASTRVLDAFVCDGRGQLQDYDDDGDVDQADIDFHVENRFANALGFSGRLTPGLVNINTAPVEVMRALPHWNKLVHANPNLVPPAWHPRSALPEAVVSYRERYDTLGASALTDVGFAGGPDYSDRLADHRTERGFASTGELRQLDRDGSIVPSPFGDSVFNLVADAWRVDFAAKEPFNQVFPDPAATAAFLSTDVTGPELVDAKLGDAVAADAEEINLLFSGALNMITTRSDVFTVYFRLRSFRQNPTTQRWDATDPEFIVDDSRYVMLVDRSEVNRPSDKPRVLYLEKLGKLIGSENSR